MLSTGKHGGDQSMLVDWLAKHETNTSIQTASLAESGIAEDLYSACFDGLQTAYRTLGSKNIISKRKAQTLREDLGKLLLWGDGFRHGRLDKALNTSNSLKADILSILQNLANLLIRSKLHDQGAVHLQILLEKSQDVTRALLDSVIESVEDDSGGGSSSEGEEPDLQSASEVMEERFFTRFCDEVSDNISCLMDFVFVLEQIMRSADSGPHRTQESAVFELSGPAHVYVTSIRDKYQHADIKLAQRAGEANWQRHVRIRAMAKPQEEEGAPATSVEAKSIFIPFSMFHDSGLGISLPAASAYAASNVSHTSFASSFGSGKESSALRVPATPVEVGTMKAFECDFCGEVQHSIKDRIAWKMHVFSDLQPYICTFPDCKDELLTFPSRKLWAEHEFSVHRVMRSWMCPFCSEECTTIEAWQDHLSSIHKTTFSGSLGPTAIATAEKKSEQPIKEQRCPFCLEYPATTRRVFVTHVGRHFEDIALATLPRDDSSDFESESRLSGDQKSAASENLAQSFADRNGASLRTDTVYRHDILESNDNASRNLYCTCQRAAFGHMVACEGYACLYVWFHWECVGLTQEPLGVWICPLCTEVDRARPEMNTQQRALSANYLKRLQGFHQQRGRKLKNVRSAGGVALDPYKFKDEIERKGGYKSVCVKQEWAEIRQRIGTGLFKQSELKEFYQQWILPYEDHLAGVNNNWESDLGSNKERGTAVEQGVGTKAATETAALDALKQHSKGEKSTSEEDPAERIVETALAENSQSRDGSTSQGPVSGVMGLFDSTGQLALPDLKARVTASRWDDEDVLCFQVDCRGVIVARREDNNMINGTKLLKAANLTRRSRDMVLQNEKIQHLVKIGSSNFKGVWIPLERALDLANEERITDMLYPLFVHNIGSLLDDSVDGSATGETL